jgi:uroporphyrinogen-III synthase
LRVLVTRPLPEAEVTARLLRDRGHAALLAPLSRIETAPALAAALTVLPATGATLLTSARAAEAVAGLLPAWAVAQPCLAVGEHTAAAARAAGFRQVVAGAGDGAALLPLIRAAVPTAAPLLYLAGEPRRPELEAALAAAGHDVRVVTTYAAVAATALPEVAVTALRDHAVDAVLHFSPRAAELYARLAVAAVGRAAAAAPRHCCLSAAVAAALVGLAPQQVAIAPRPNQQSLLALLSS